GIQKFYEFLGASIKYPKAAFENNIQGTTYLSFLIEKDGSLTDITVQKGSGNTLLDDEAKRIVNIMPKWIAGQQNGKSVPVYFNLPIKFSDYNVQC
ncbi:MAG: energy transducer TonB, partial [Pseudomonadota bacterium]